MKLLLCSFLLFCGAAVAADKPDVLELIAIDGVIDDGMAAQVTKKVEEINDNPRVKAVFMTVDSPGGGVLASAVIYEELSKLKVPVVGFCQNICASGGMYVLMAPSVKFIAVRTQTISGSIGVVMHITRYHRLLDWARIDSETYKSGERKDYGSPERPPTDEEKAALQDEIKGLADSFYAIVVKARGDKISATNLADIKRAGIYFGPSGVKVGLVDAVMTKEDATKKAKELSGSKSIYTRDELKKISKDANSSDFGSFSTEDLKPSMVAEFFGDFQWALAWVKEVRSGGSVKFEFRAPYTF